MSVIPENFLSDLVLAGLGNPGPQYSATRHNLGRHCLEELSGRLGAPISRKRWRSKVGSVELGGRRIWLVAPETFMNMSGRAVADAVRDLGPGTEVWAVYDELDLPLCRLRIRMAGSAGGHNGVKSLIACLGSPAFVRFRVGIGRPGSAEQSVDHVLGRFSKSEAEAVPKVISGVADALELALREGLKAAMDQYNRLGSLGCEQGP